MQNLVLSGNPLYKNRVDANPVYGKMYKFTTALPIQKMIDWHEMMQPVWK
jgi:hypothetical protein